MIGMKMSEKTIEQQLAQKIVDYISERRDTKLEAFLKDKPKRNKKGEVTNGAINERARIVLERLAKEKSSDDKLKQLELINKSKKAKEQTSLDFQLRKFEDYKQLFSSETKVGQADLFGESSSDDVIVAEIHELSSELNDFIATNNKVHVPVNWLSEQSLAAKDVSFATHVAKITHPSSRGSSLLDNTTECRRGILSTSCLQKKAIDVAVSNAASNPIGVVLQISAGGFSLLDFLKNGNVLPLEIISKDKEVANDWAENLKKSYSNENVTSHFLNKQVYFPVWNNKYHLLLPLVSSSISHKLYEQILEYNEGRVLVSKAKKAGTYSELLDSSYPRKAILSVTDNPKSHSNVSQLNNKRKGQHLLLSCQPPEWSESDHGIDKKQTIFDRKLQHVLKEEIDDLKVYLSLLRNKHLSSSHPQRNASIKKKTLTIIAAFFDYIESISMTVNQPIDAAAPILPTEQKMLFFTLFEKESNSKSEMSEDWQIKLSKTFAHWLNQQLNKGKRSLGLTPIHEAIWIDWFSVKLREYSITKEATL